MCWYESYASFNVYRDKQDGKTALIKAANKGHEDIVEKLISHGVDVNVKDKVICIKYLHISTVSRYDVIWCDMRLSFFAMP